MQRRSPGQGLPRSYLQADLDFLLPGGGTTEEQLLGDSEVGRRGAQRVAPACPPAAAAPLLAAAPTHLCARRPAQMLACIADALDALPELGPVELRVGHRQLFEAVLQWVGVPRELRGGVVQLLSTALAASPLHVQARSKRWPAIR